jgi:hypothetical protein
VEKIRFVFWYLAEHNLITLEEMTALREKWNTEGLLATKKGLVAKISQLQSRYDSVQEQIRKANSFLESAI